MTEFNPRIVPIDELDVAEDKSMTIRVNPPSGPRKLRAFARLAAVVDRVPATEVPMCEPPVSDAGILVHTRPPEPRGSGPRLRQEAIEALAQAEADHDAALEQSRRCWQTVHGTEEQVAGILAEESAALCAFELIRDSRRNAERTLRQARSEGKAASQHCLITSRFLDGARIRAERL